MLFSLASFSLFSLSLLLLLTLRPIFSNDLTATMPGEVSKVRPSSASRSFFRPEERAAAALTSAAAAIVVVAAAAPRPPACRPPSVSSSSSVVAAVVAVPALPLARPLRVVVVDHDRRGGRGGGRMTFFSEFQKLKKKVRKKN